MTDIRVRDLDELRARLAQDVPMLKAKVDKALPYAAAKTTIVMKGRVPVAFGELHDSIHVAGNSAIADAPHAAAVEVGSRPHLPPLEPLIAWVKRRGMQGLGAGPNTWMKGRKRDVRHARVIAGRLQELANARGGTANEVDDPVKIARQIQFAIGKRGTKPSWFARGSLPKIKDILREVVGQALRGNP